MEEHNNRLLIYWPSVVIMKLEIHKKPRVMTSVSILIMSCEDDGEFV
jgi:hypothetical protein